ncbi:hypothetical protein TNCV_3627931 [Trichonephila clavipes]|nr:hypothetical protein TNCV_3627931 [Trichonephila clavipes]
MHSALAAWGDCKQPSSRKSSREVGGRGREVGGPWPKIGVEPSKIVLSPAFLLKAKANAGVKFLALSRDEFRGPRSDYVRLVALVTTQQQEETILILWKVF